MAGRDDEWVRRWNGERLAASVAAALHRWEDDPAQAAGGLDRLFRAAPPRAILLLERLYRDRHYTLAAQVGARIDTLAKDHGPHAAAVAALLTLDRSGYLREAGVRLLAGDDAAFALPFLLLRLNDPVEAVRQRAGAALRARLDVSDTAQVAALRPLMEALSRRRRSGPIVSTLAGRAAP